MTIIQSDAVTTEPRRPMTPRAGLALAAGTTLLAMLAVHVTVFPSVLAALASLALFLSGVVLLWIKLPHHYPHSRFGFCNAVTLLRAGLGATLVAPLLFPGLYDDIVKGWAVVLVATIALSLDGVDGWLARRSGLNSAFGARFDMEIDAALALLLSLLVLADGNVGPIVLVLGLMRYAFVAASWGLPWMTAPLPDRFGRKVVCVIQIAALIALQAPMVTGNVALIIAFSASLALFWSFGRDVIWLWRHRT